MIISNIVVAMTVAVTLAQFADTPCCCCCWCYWPAVGYRLWRDIYIEQNLLFLSESV